MPAVVKLFKNITLFCKQECLDNWKNRHWQAVNHT